MNKTKIYFRADGNTKIGLGHVIRSLALVDMLREEFECVFIYKNILPSLIDDIQKSCTQSISVPEHLNYLEEADWMLANIFDGHEMLVLDGYFFNTAYQKKLKPAVHKLICIDDIHTYHFVADVVINHSSGISLENYSLSTNTQLFAGLDYLLLRKPFREAARNRHYKKKKKGHVLICMGGSDPKNSTLDLIKVLIEIEGIYVIHIVIGKAYPHLEVMQKYIKTIPQEIRLVQDLSAKEMVKLMQICPIAITSASTISYEYLSVGGLLFLKVIADNQTHVFQYLTENKLAFSIEELHRVNEIDSSVILKNQTEVFDGKQKKRLISIFKNLI